MKSQHASDFSGASARPLRVDAEVIENRHEGGVNRRLVLRVDAWPGSQPGQFVMLSPGPRSVADPCDPLLPRPMAIYRAQELDGGGTAVEVLYKVTGRGTQLLAESIRGQYIRVVGPLGQGFPDPRQTAANLQPVLVGGGTGIASLYDLAARATAGNRAPSDIAVILGARGAEDMMGVEDFAGLGVTLHLTTEDGSLGERGRVTEPLEALLANPCEVYACGPTPMMWRCAELSKRRGARCWVSLENNMACGFGVCLGCAAPKRSGGFALVCTHGPVFDSESVDWEGLP